MEEFNPPIQARSEDQLIIIAGSSNGDWQQSAIDQAVAELKKRGVTVAQQNSRLLEFEAQEKQELERRSVEDYHWFEKIMRIILWPKYLFRSWNLENDGYILKAKRRKQLLGVGILFWTLMLIWANSIWKEDQIRREKEIEATDISAWEKNKLPLGSTSDSSVVIVDPNNTVGN